jgi:hypothetical protein
LFSASKNRARRTLDRVHVLSAGFLLCILSFCAFADSPNDFLAPKSGYQVIITNIIEAYRSLVENMPQKVSAVRPNEKNLEFFYKLTGRGFEYKTLKDQPQKMLALVIQPTNDFDDFISRFKENAAQKHPTLFQQMSFLKRESNHIGIASLLLPKNSGKDSEQEIARELERIIKTHAVRFTIAFEFLALTKNGDVIIVGIPDHECLLQLRDAVKSSQKLKEVVAKNGLLIPYFIHSTICRILPDADFEYAIDDDDLRTLNNLIDDHNPLSLEMEVDRLTLWNYDRGLDAPHIIKRYPVNRSC